MKPVRYSLRRIYSGKTNGKTENSHAHDDSGTKNIQNSIKLIFSFKLKCNEFDAVVLFLSLCGGRRVSRPLLMSYSHRLHRADRIFSVAASTIRIFRFLSFFFVVVVCVLSQTESVRCK